MGISRFTRMIRRYLPLDYCGAVIVAAGNATRMGGIDKTTALLGADPVIVHTVRAFEQCEAIKEIVVVTNGLTGKSAIDYLENITEKITVVDYANQYSSNKFEVVNNSKVIKINGQNRIESLDIRLDNGDIINKPCTAVFVAMGKSTNLDLFALLDKKDGYLLTDENMRTNINSVFVAGDIRYKSLRQIVTACADGAIAATEAIKYIANN